MRRLVIPELSLHIDATNGIIDAILDISEIGHDIPPETTLAVKAPLP
ncbi:MAG: hypothetical protein ACJ8FZ_19855 [Bradyrhizobium sp.]